MGVSRSLSRTPSYTIRCRPSRHGGRKENRTGKGDTEGPRKISRRPLAAGLTGGELNRVPEAQSPDSRVATITIPGFSSTPRSRRKLVVAVLCFLGVAAAAGAWYFGGHRLPAGQPSITRLTSGSKHVAVLPFQISGAGDKAGIVADGLVEMITEALSDFQRFQGKAMPVPASEIRRREITTVGDARRIYGVDLAITGSAKSQENRIQFTLQLVDAASSRQIDASAFEYDPPRRGQPSIGPLEKWPGCLV